MTTLTIAYRKADHSIGTFHVETAPDYTHLEAARDVADMVTQTEKHTPTVVLVGIPGGKT